MEGAGRKKLVRKAIECAVCAEEFNKMTRERIKCKYCNYECCRACNTQYLETAGGEAKCMNCQKIWNREDIIDMFGQGFIERVYKPARGKYLYDLAKLRIPELQTTAARFREMRQDNVAAKARLATLQEKITRLCECPPYDGIINVRGRVIRDRGQILQKIRETSNAETVNIRTIRLIMAEIPVEASSSSTVRDQAVKKCHCNGMVMRKSMKCGNCQEEYCRECYEQKGEGHECDKGTVETVKLLSGDTKPCPKCTCQITKIDGCDQMWCPECKTAFSWNTGRIETGVIHNPHYYYWMRDHGAEEELARQAREMQGMDEDERIECENITDQQAFRIIQRMISRTAKYNIGLDANKMFKIGQFALHVQQVEMPKYTQRETANEKLEIPIIKFLLNDISEKALISEILKKDKAISKARDIFTNLQTFRLVSVNLCLQMSMGLKGRNTDMVRLALRQFDELLDFTNAGFDRISEIYDDAGPLKIANVPGGLFLGTIKEIETKLRETGSRGMRAYVLH